MDLLSVVDLVFLTVIVAADWRGNLWVGNLAALKVGIVVVLMAVWKAFLMAEYLVYDWVAL